jgi:hypothetical protein
MGQEIEPKEDKATISQIIFVTIGIFLVSFAIFLAGMRWDFMKNLENTTQKCQEYIYQYCTCNDFIIRPLPTDIGKGGIFNGTFPG